MTTKDFLAIPAERRKQLAPVVRAERRRQGLSQGDLAKAAAVSRQSIVNFETGAKVPQTAKLRQILDALGLEAGEERFEEDTQAWLAIVGTVVESIPVAHREQATSSALASLLGFKAGLNSAAPSNVTPLRQTNNATPGAQFDEEGFDDFEGEHNERIAAQRGTPHEEQ